MAKKTLAAVQWVSVMLLSIGLSTARAEENQSHADAKAAEVTVVQELGFVATCSPQPLKNESHTELFEVKKPCEYKTIRFKAGDLVRVKGGKVYSVVFKETAVVGSLKLKADGKPAYFHSASEQVIEMTLAEPAQIAGELWPVESRLRLNGSGDLSQSPLWVELPTAANIRGQSLPGGSRLHFENDGQFSVLN